MLVFCLFVWSVKGHLVADSHTRHQLDTQQMSQTKDGFRLLFISDPLARQHTRRGLHKSEELHALARQVAYGKQGKITGRDLQAQKNTSNSLTFIIACIIYWQAEKLNRDILECEPEEAGVDLDLLEHISPIGWESIVLYGEHVLNRNLIKG